MMISFNFETLPTQVEMTNIHNVKNGQHFVFMGGFSQASLTKKIIGKGQWYAFLHENGAYVFSHGIPS